MDGPLSESLMNTLALINMYMRLFYIHLCCGNICEPTICLRAWKKRFQNLLSSHERNDSPSCSLSVFGQEMLQLLKQLGKDLFTGERAKTRKWWCQQLLYANLTWMMCLMFGAYSAPGALQLYLHVLRRERRDYRAFVRVAPGDECSPPPWPWRDVNECNSMEGKSNTEGWVCPKSWNQDTCSHQRPLETTAFWEHMSAVTRQELRDWKAPGRPSPF